MSERGYGSLDEMVLAGDGAETGESKELREGEPETRKASIMAVLAVEESAAEIVTWGNSG